MKAKRTNIIKKQGTKTLAGILAVCMTFGTPISVLADDNTSDSTMEQQAGVQNVLAKKVDGSETLVKVSEVVLGMIQRNEVKLDTDKFLKDVTTGQKVDPTTGERVTELGTPVEPSEPEIPTTPTEPSEPSEPEIPETPAEPSEPEAPTTPSEPDEPETPADNIENTETDQNGQANQEEAVQTENTEIASNEDLISRQQIVKLPQIIDDFRFWTVARTYAFAKDNLYVRESIPEGIDGTADTSDESLKADKSAAKKEAKKLNNIKEEIIILTATSGDTGKAALQGFSNVDGFKVVVYYPENGVSAIQEKQMLTQEGNNVEVIGIRGNFDNAQSGVKKIFGDIEFKKELKNIL